MKSSCWACTCWATGTSSCKRTRASKAADGSRAPGPTSARRRSASVEVPLPRRFTNGSVLSGPAEGASLGACCLAVPAPGTSAGGCPPVQADPAVLIQAQRVARGRGGLRRWRAVERRAWPHHRPRPCNAGGSASPAANLRAISVCPFMIVTQGDWIGSLVFAAPIRRPSARTFLSGRGLRLNPERG